MTDPVPLGQEPEAGEGTAPPAVSILMPVRDAELTLEEAIESVIAQTYGLWELLISDDGSRDGSVRIARRYAKSDPRVRVLVAETSSGAAAARNRALEAARGRFIAFLDADDLWLPEKLDRQVALLRETGAALSYTAFVRRAERGDRVRPVPAFVDYDTLLRGNIIGCLSAMYDSGRIGKRPMAEIPRRHDYALWLEILREAGPAVGLEEPLAIHRMSRGSLSANKIAAVADTWRMYRDIVGLSRLRAAECLVSHLFMRVLS